MLEMKTYVIANTCLLFNETIHKFLWTQQKKKIKHINLNNFNILLHSTPFCIATVFGLFSVFNPESLFKSYCRRFFIKIHEKLDLIKDKRIKTYFYSEKYLFFAPKKRGFVVKSNKLI